jgi:hypothetical protein
MLRQSLSSLLRMKLSVYKYNVHTLFLHRTKNPSQYTHYKPKSSFFFLYIIREWYCPRITERHAHAYARTNIHHHTYITRAQLRKPTLDESTGEILFTCRAKVVTRKTSFFAIMCEKHTDCSLVRDGLDFVVISSFLFYRRN